jgi:hypothetical protein
MTKIDEPVKGKRTALAVIPAKAGIQILHPVMDSGFRRSDGNCASLRFHQIRLNYLYHFRFLKQLDTDYASIGFKKLTVTAIP